MACDTNNQPPSDTDHQKNALDAGAGDTFAAKLDHLVDFRVYILEEKSMWVEMCKHGGTLFGFYDSYKYKYSKFEMFFSSIVPWWR